MRQIIFENFAIETRFIISVDAHIFYNNNLTEYGVRIVMITGKEYFFSTGLKSDGKVGLIHAEKIVNEWVKSGKLNLDGLKI